MDTAGDPPFRELADTAPAILWTTDASGQCIYLSRGWYDYTGQPPGGGQGVGWLDAVHADDRGPAAQAFRKANECKSEYRLDFRLRRADGQYRWVIDAGRPRLDGSGRLLGFVGSVIDIHERVEAERRSEHGLAELRAVLTSMNDGLIASDPTGTNIQWNPAALAMHGYTSANQVRQSLAQFADIFTLRTREGRVLHVDEWPLSRVLRGETFSGCELDLERNDTGLRLTLSYSGRPVVDAKGNTVLGVLTQRDVTERVEAERRREALLSAERAAREEAQRVSRLKDEFLATLSHELRTPLGAILGWSQLLTAGDPSPQDLREGLETIDRNARLQRQIIEDLLDMSRLVGGNLRLDVADVDIARLVRQAADAVRPAAATRDVALDLPDTPGPVVRGDTLRLQQVFWNLLSNAVKFTPAGGRVSVNVRPEPDGGVQVTVTDTGQGIVPDFLPHVFERFRQADATSTRRHGGLGLGLSLVRHLVDLHGGTVSAQSDGLGRGATFAVRLPAELPARPGAQHAPARPDAPEAPAEAVDDLLLPRLAGRAVLLVPAAPASLDDVADMFVRWGCDVKIARATDAGSRRAELVVIDVGADTPDVAFARAVDAAETKDARGRPGVPVLALTSPIGPEVRARLILAGFGLCVSRPADPAEIGAAAASLIERGCG